MIIRVVILAKAETQSKNTGFRVKPGMTDKVKKFLVHYTRSLRGAI
jgi:hypothetical protein